MSKNNVEISVEAYEILLNESSRLGVSISDLLVMRAKCNTPNIFLPKSVIHSARITQKEAMQYVNISILSDFRDWVQFYNVPYAQVGNRKLFRKSALDKAILQDEQQTLDS